MTTLPIDAIKTDGGTQPRAALNFAVVDEYMDLMKDGVKFPPVVVFYDGTTYWLADGFHRHQAAWQAEFEEIAAEVHQGTREDAMWYSFGANKGHGLRRSTDDKQRAIKAALQHPKSAGLSDSAIAKHVGVDHKTVAACREKIAPILGISQDSSTRTVTRNGTTYQQNVANIGKRVDMTPPPPTEPPKAAVAQPEVQPICDRKVAGSTPASGSNLRPVEKPEPKIDTSAHAAELLKAIYDLAEHKISAVELSALVPEQRKAEVYQQALRATEFLTFVCQGTSRKGVA